MTSNRPSSSSASSATAVRSRKRPRTKKEATERFLNAASAMIDRLPADDVQKLAMSAESAIAEPSQDTVGRSVLSGEPLPSPADVSAARWRNLERAFSDRRRLLEDAVSVSEAAQLLGVGRQAPHDRLAARALVGIKDRGQWRLPAWQFDAEGPDGTLPGLPEVLRALQGPISDLGRIRWFVTPKASLDGTTPVDALRAGDTDSVIEAAEALGAS
jgi:hypothetical protein